MNDSENSECPLCMEPYEIDDLNFFPCTCGYQVCRFCWHRIRTDENGLCPACRKAYTEDPAIFQPLTSDEVQQIKKTRKQRDQQKKYQSSENRKHLASVRVIQKNLLFVVGLSNKLADAEVLRRNDMFGKYGKIIKIVINPSTNYAGPQGPSASAYITFSRDEETQTAILGANNVTMDGRLLRASLGTTKYCSYFLRNLPCTKVDCMYLHEVADQAASFTKEDMQMGKHVAFEKLLMEQFLAANCSANISDEPRKSVSPSTEVKIRSSTKAQPSQDQICLSSNNSRPSSANSDSKPPGVVSQKASSAKPQALVTQAQLQPRPCSKASHKAPPVEEIEDFPPIVPNTALPPTVPSIPPVNNECSQEAAVNPMRGWPLGHGPDLLSQFQGMWPDSNLGLTALHNPDDDDDLDFDPFEESNIALTELINKEASTSHGEPTSGKPSRDEPQQLWQQPLNAFQENTFDLHKSSSDNNQSYSLFGAGLIRGAGFSSNLRELDPIGQEFYQEPYAPAQSTGTAEMPYGLADRSLDTPGPNFLQSAVLQPNSQQHQQQQQWQANLRSLLPNVNISFAGHPKAPQSHVEVPSDLGSVGHSNVCRPPPGFDKPNLAGAPTLFDVSEVDQSSRLNQAVVEDPSILWSKLETDEYQCTPAVVSHSTITEPRHQTESVLAPVVCSVTTPPSIISPNKTTAKATQAVTPWTSVVMTTKEGGEPKAAVEPRRGTEAVALSIESPRAATAVFAAHKTPPGKKPTAKVKPLNMVNVPHTRVPVVPNPPGQVAAAIGSNMDALDDFEIDEPAGGHGPPPQAPMAVATKDVVKKEMQSDGAKSKRKKKNKKNNDEGKPNAVARKADAATSNAEQRATKKTATTNEDQPAFQRDSAQQQQQQQQQTSDQDMFSRLAESTEKLLHTVLSETAAIKTNTEQLSKDLREALERCKEVPPSRSDLDKINSLLMSSNFEKFRSGGGEDVRRLDTSTLERQVETAKREATLWETKLNDLIRKNVSSDVSK